MSEIECVPLSPAPICLSYLRRKLRYYYYTYTYIRLVLRLVRLLDWLHSLIANVYC